MRRTAEALGSQPCCARPSPGPSPAPASPPAARSPVGRAGVPGPWAGLLPVRCIPSCTPASASPQVGWDISPRPLWPGQSGRALTRTHDSRQMSHSPLPLSPLASGQTGKVNVGLVLFTTPCPLSPRFSTSDQPLVLATQKSLQIKTKGCLVCSGSYMHFGGPCRRSRDEGQGIPGLDGVRTGRCAEKEAEPGVRGQYTRCQWLAVGLPRGCALCGRSTRQAAALPPPERPFLEELQLPTLSH